MVQNGKFSAGAEALVSTLKNVDFLYDQRHQSNFDCEHHMLLLSPHPTLGRPTIPHFNDVPNRPRRGPGPSAPSLFFFGGMTFLPRTKTSCKRWQTLSTSNPPRSLLAARASHHLTSYTNSCPSTCVVSCDRHVTIIQHGCQEQRDEYCLKESATIFL